MRPNPRRHNLGNNDRQDLAEIETYMSEAVGHIEPVARGERMLPEESSRRGLSALVALERGRRLLAEILGRPRHPSKNSNGAQEADEK